MAANPDTRAPTVSLEGRNPQDIANMAALSEALSTNPATAREYQKLVKKAYPDVRMPELEMESSLEAATKPLVERIEKLDNAIQQREARERLTKIEQAAISAGATPEEISDGTFQKWAQEQGFAITQLDKAARYRTMERQLSTPTPAETPFGLKPEDLKDMRKNPEKYAHEELNRIRGRRAA